MQKQYLNEIFRNSFRKIDVSDDFELKFEFPKNEDHGDMACNSAMQLAKILKKKPIDIANAIVDNLEYNSQIIDSVNIAGPGFINIKFTTDFYADALEKLLEYGSDFGKQSIGNGKSVNIEYVSVNPTGLLHLGHGRNACLGDTIANLYEWLGYDITREYYFNNAGNQMNVLAKSIYARYRQLFDSSYPFPEEGYHGDYINLIANELREQFGDKYSEESEEAMNICRKFGENWCFKKIQNTLERLDIVQDVYYNEDSLYKEGKIQSLLDSLKEKELIYEKDEAKWLRLSEMGLEQDRVIVKSTGEPTYRLPDIAYHMEKFNRNYNIIIDIFGSDHIATIPDVMATLKALGYNTDIIKVVIHQFVTIKENDKQVKMSKRTGKSYTLDDLLDEVGADVVRFFLIMRSASTHLEFDLSLAREQSEKNPVFYLQYAHARISSIFEKFKDLNIKIPENIDYSKLQSEYEIGLIKQIMNFEEIIINAADKYEPQLLADYLRDTASKFHLFYHNCPILKAEEELMFARLKLSELTKNVLYNGLKILGITAPNKM